MFFAKPFYIWLTAEFLFPPALCPFLMCELQKTRNDPKYADVPKSILPLIESLKTTKARFLPLWENEIVPDIKAGKRLVIAAHGNTIRALVQHLDGISEGVICELNVPTGVPLIYDLDENMKPVKHSDAIAPLQGHYLGDQEKIRAKIAGVAAQTGPKKWSRVG